MERYFNTTGSCNPKRHYMVNIEGRLAQIKRMIDRGEYFTINRARQYGKTTTIQALTEYLRADYIVISLDFQMLGNAKFETEHVFSLAFANYLKRTANGKQVQIDGLDHALLEEIAEQAKNEELFAFDDLFPLLSELCDTAKKPVILLIDEVDSATNNQVFLDFLAQLRAYYLKRDTLPTFQSVILAGVYDVKNIKRKIRPDEAHKINSPWNIAADFKVDMSFAQPEIAKMLEDYETDHHTGMDIDRMSGLLSDYTSGYPFLVSRLCKLIDEDIAGSNGYPDKTAAWTKNGFLEAVKLLLAEKNTLFESLIGKLYDYPELRKIVYALLFGGEQVVYSPDEQWMDIAMMFGFVKTDADGVKIANRIFEMRLYNYFLATAEAQSSAIFQAGSQNKPQFIQNGRLNMTLVLKKFVQYFDDIYGDTAEPFDEEEGRRRFLLFLRPIINGAGNYYIEAETRNARRMDVVVDYSGEQFIIELKIWRGNAYNERGEQQLADYLDYFHLKKGYMLSYNFNQKKETGVKEIGIGDRTLVEAVV